MVELYKAYDDYDGFKKKRYFTIRYDILPSDLEVSIPLQRSKEQVAKVLGMIDVKRFELGVVFKIWKTSNYNNAEIEEDFVKEYLFESKSRKLIVWVKFTSSNLNVNFLYDANDKEVEAWILATNHELRTKLGEEKMPSFKILSTTRGNFYTEDINTKNFEQLDIAQFYNDDFQEIDQIITDSIKEVKSGLILLHGKPGTGKTTYIKNLISSFRDQDFIFVQNDLVPELLKPDFVSFLVENKNCILIIEDAEKVVMSREAQESSVVSTILQLTDGLFSDYLNIKVICSFNTNLEKIDKALLRKGRMIARYEFKDLTKDKANQLLKQLGYEEMDKPMSVAEIHKLNHKDFQEEEKQKIGFN